MGLVYLKRFPKTEAGIILRHLIRKLHEISNHKDRTRSLIKNALPNMFYYLDDSKIPKSSNGLECRFSYLKNNLNIHRGLTKKNRKNFILWYNYFKYNP
ncbi:hypothetical protein CVV26_02605 [Candidatus Kuenenbacteria bacterium HGW-Kuenenbacteria-1]|uniref:Uncharacterized protein n=1 Tax=Candidatus Kuenenbacteria bacterium HGW-Kuenenbacteria-1 TaxID=2013812 RepID=A0A2N1UN47_9BACT|nr:MAG: hypothetical protein CVV26_02605 [Candidatus Kuenenbacteria bacterium HGW-Kuenenbacteria-1]